MNFYWPGCSLFFLKEHPPSLGELYICSYFSQKVFGIGARMNLFLSWLRLAKRQESELKLAQRSVQDYSNWSWRKCLRGIWGRSRNDLEGDFLLWWERSKLDVTSATPWRNLLRSRQEWSGHTDGNKDRTNTGLSWENWPLPSDVRSSHLWTDTYLS